MTAVNNIENRVSIVKKYLKILERYKQYSQREIEGDLEKRGAVERYLYLAAQSTVDLAESVISFKKYRKPTSLSDTFYILNEEELISSELTKSLVAMTGFRNILSHEYENLSYEIVCDVLKNNLQDIEEFLDIISDSFKI